MKLILTEAQIKEILHNEYIKNYDPNIEKILETRGSFPNQDDIYVCHPHEINALVSSVSSELLEKFTTVSNFKENLKATQAYQIYKKILDDDLPTFKSASRQDKHNLFDSISNLGLYKKETQGKGTWFDAMLKMIEKRAKYAIKAICRNASLYYEDLRSGLVDYPL